MAATLATATPNMSHDMIRTRIKKEMTSNHPALTWLMNSLRLTMVTVRKMYTPNIESDSMRIVMYGLISLRISIGLISVSGREDQAQKVSAIIMNTAARIAVITVDRIISLRSGSSSLTVVNTNLENRGFMIHS